MDQAFKEEDKINLIVASKHPRPQFYSVDEAEELVREGYKVIDWASTVSADEEPDLVIAAAGTEPNLEALAAVTILHKAFPELKIRFVNVVDILKLRHPSVDARGLSDEEFDKVFTTDKPVIFAFHGYEGMIRDIFFNRHNHNLRVHGYRENGDITTHSICVSCLNWIASTWHKMRLMLHLEQMRVNLQLKWMKQLPSIMHTSVSMVMIFQKSTTGNGKM